MATKRIDQLPAATAQTDHEIPAMRAGVTSKITVAGIGGDYLPLVGGTLSGDLKINAALPWITLNETGTGTGVWIGAQRGGVDRWWIALGNGVAETGADAGSSFQLFRYSDAGVDLGPALDISRATGNATFTGTVIAPAATTAQPSLRIPHGVAPTTPANGDMWTTNSGLYVRINGVTLGPVTTTTVTTTSSDIEALTQTVQALQARIEVLEAGG